MKVGGGVKRKLLGVQRRIQIRFLGRLHLG